MFVEKLNEIMKNKDYVKSLAIGYLSKKYGKPVEFFKHNLEEKSIYDIFYFKRIDEEGEKQDIVYIFDDFGFSCSRENREHHFVAEWINLVYSKLLKISPDLANNYLSYVEKEMNQVFNECMLSKYQEIDYEYKRVVAAARLVRNKKREGLNSALQGMRKEFAGILASVNKQTNNTNGNNV